MSIQSTLATIGSVIGSIEAVVSNPDTDASLKSTLTSIIGQLTSEQERFKSQIENSGTDNVSESTDIFEQASRAAELVESEEEPEEKPHDKYSDKIKEYLNKSSGKLEKVALPFPYPMYYITKDSGVLCPDCANQDRVDYNDPSDPQWYIVAADVNYEDDSLYCDHCSKRIESAYAEPKEPEENVTEGKKWSAGVTTSKSVPAGLFSRSSEEIAEYFHANRDSLKSAMSALSFEENRAGKNLSGEQIAKLDSAKVKLRELFGKKEESVKNTIRSTGLVEAVDPQGQFSVFYGKAGADKHPPLYASVAPIGGRSSYGSLTIWANETDRWENLLERFGEEANGGELYVSGISLGVAQPKGVWSIQGREYARKDIKEAVKALQRGDKGPEVTDAQNAESLAEQDWVNRPSVAVRVIDKPNTDTSFNPADNMSDFARITPTKHELKTNRP